MKLRKTRLLFIFLILSTLTFLYLVKISEGIGNPAAIYCKALGYEYEIEKTKEGEIGYCILPNGVKVDEWKFFNCEEWKEYSYCEINGLKAENRSDGCYCILENGTAVKVEKLMNLSFGASVICGDKRCEFLIENYLTCPQDCPSGSLDGICDGVADGKCDPDCRRLNQTFKDPECIYCGNGICEDNESWENCCKDCGCPLFMECKDNKCISKKCGNHKCEIRLAENYLTCPQDCPSGSLDGICDGVADGKCDPDCTENEDIDCKPLFPFYLLILIPIFILLLFIILKTKRE